MTLSDFVARLSELATSALVIATAAVFIYQLASGFLKERLDLHPFDPEKDDDAVGLIDIVRSELIQLQSEGAGSSPFLAFGPDLPLALPSEISVLSLNLLQQLVKLLPSRTLHVTGRIHPLSVNGYGVSLTLTGAFDRTRMSTTFWEADLDFPTELPESIDAKVAKQERYQRLAIAAASWIAYALLDDLPAATRTPLLSQDWRSYAIFRVGAEMQLQQAGNDYVREMYQRALRRDPHNRGALFNVAALYNMDRAHFLAKEALDACVEEIEAAYGAVHHDWRTDRLWYRAKFNAGAVRVNEVTARHDDSTSHVPGAAFPGELEGSTLLDEARRAFMRVAQEATATLGVYAGTTEEQTKTTLAELGRHSELVHFLAEMRSISLAAYQAALVVRPSA